MTGTLDCRTSTHPSPSTSAPPAALVVSGMCGHARRSAAEYACAECFGPLEVGYDFGAHHPRGHRSRAPGRSGATAGCCPCPTTSSEHPDTRARADPADPRRPARQGAGHARGCGSRTTPATRRTPSRTGWWPSRWPPPASSASQVLACASTGNLANAVAAAAARAGLRVGGAHPLRPGAGKVLTTAVYDGDAGRRRRHLRRRQPAGHRARRRARGLGVRQRQRPALLRRGLQDARLRGRRAARLAAARAGRRADRVRLAADQGGQGVPRARPSSAWSSRRRTGCSAPRPPAARRCRAAFEAGHDVVAPVRPDTIAKSLAIGNPADGPYALDAVRRTGGAIEDVTDDEIVEGIRLLARTEGIFAETAGGVTVAVREEAGRAGQLDPDAETVVSTPATGSRRWTRWRGAGTASHCGAEHQSRP